jgi:RND family efflux transporter MFP subunit
VSALSALRAHDLELKRTQKLAQIGAASTQELERVHAEHTAQASEVNSARARLTLLGVRDVTDGIDSMDASSAATSTVRAAIGGVVTQRQANVGLNVEPSTTLFTIVDLSTVWVVANVFEKDFAVVRVGAHATVTAQAYPQVEPTTRTARMRVEVPNPDMQLRLGMYTAVAIESASSRAVPVVPRVAVQSMGARTVVYLANHRMRGQYIEREVTLGRAHGDQVEVLSGVRPGDVVVTTGSFFVRAERERVGQGRPAGAQGVGPGGAAPAPTPGVPEQRAEVQVSRNGFEPSTLRLRAGIPARITFTRTTDETCARAVQFPSLHIRRDLPLRRPVDVVFTPTTRNLAFACGMDMLSGTVVAQ